MLNVNQITSQLAKMPDQALQQYAAMHKNDPYVLALAISESNRRKEMRSGAQMHGAQQQPKVVDQELAQMAQPMPEEVGIGALPAQNMQGMAGGGIVAFDEGGGVNMGGVSAIPYYYPGPSEERDRLNRLPGVWWDEAGNALRSGWNRFTEGTTIEAQRKEEQAAAAAAAEQAAAKAQARKFPPIKGADTRMQMGASTDPRVAAMQATLPADNSGAGAQGAGLSQLIPGAAGAATPANRAAMPTLFQTDKLPEKAEYTKEYDELYKALDDKQAKFLENQKSKLKTDREESLYMAMIKGGLAAAAGTSKNALQNIAKGFGEGAEDFNSSLKEFRKAAQETAKIELEMQRAQADRKAGRMDKYDAKVEKAKEMALERDKALLSANTQLQAAGITAGAHIAAAKLPTREERLYTALSDPNSAVAKGFKTYAETMGPEAKGESALLAKYAGPQGEMALKMLEAGSPQEKQLAAAIRAKMSAAMLTPTSVPGAGGARP